MPSVRGSTTRLRRPFRGDASKAGIIGSVPISDVLVAAVEQVQQFGIGLEIAELVRAAQIHDVAAAVAPGIVLDQRIGAEVAEADTGFPPVGDQGDPGRGRVLEGVGDIVAIVVACVAGGIVGVDREPGKRAPEGDDLIAAAMAGAARLDRIGIADEPELAAEIQPPPGRGDRQPVELEPRPQPA